MEYDVTNFVEKNRDSLGESLAETARRSSNALLKVRGLDNGLQKGGSKVGSMELF